MNETKRCCRCREVKPLSEFAKQRSESDGHQRACRACATLYQREHRNAHPEKKAEEAKKALERYRLRYRHDEAYRKRAVLKARKWRQGLTTEERQKRNREHYLRYNYDLTPQEFNETANAQSHRCGCCKKASRRLVVDHDHTTGRIRGLICRHCNGALGAFGDNIDGLKQAVAYLESKQIAFAPLTFVA